MRKLLALALLALPCYPATVVFLTSTTTTPTYTVPMDWNSANNTIEVIGGGGGGVDNSNSCYSGAGGGGYAKISNLTLVPGASVTYQVGAGGAPFGNGGNSWFNASTLVLSSVGAIGGAPGSRGSCPQSGGLGGAALSCVGAGATCFSGGNGGASFYRIVNGWRRRSCWSTRRWR